MKNKEEELDEFFSKGLAHYKETPSLKAWDAIEQELHQSTHKLSYWIAASVAVVLIVCTTVWYNVLDTSFNYEIASSALNVSRPQKEFIPVPLIIYTTTVVYVEKELQNHYTENQKEENSTPVVFPISASFDIKQISNSYAFYTKMPTNEPVKLVYNINEPITIIYKRGDPKYPKLAKAANFFKQVGEGNRPLIDFEKISAELLARRDNFNNSNK